MRSPVMRRVAAIVCVASIVMAGAFIAYRAVFGPKTITAYFVSATGIYPGDQVKVAGVRVGTVTGIEPQADNAKVTMTVDHGVPIPADAKAVIVAQNLVAARYVQLTPVYVDSGPTMRDGAVIPTERSAVPVEWDQVKDQLTRLATDLGPQAQDPAGSVSRLIDSTANALGGNGDKLRESLAQLSGVARILAEGSGDIVGFIKNLQVFVAALRDSNQQIVEFEGRLATLSSVLDGSRSDLDGALTNLSVAVGDVQRFVAGTRDKTAEQVARLANVTQTLVDSKKDVEQLLHIFPTSLSNFYNIYDPVTGTEAGTFGVNNESNPVAFTCAAFAAVEPGDPAQGVKKCAEYLGPVLRLLNPLTYLNFNYLPIPVNPFLAPDPRPDQLIYSQPDLIPGVVGPDGPPPPPTTDQMLLPAERPSP
jgi:phospholipid/cholesterol/gamma-HCH transport system substrate-binding protein